MSSFAVPRSSIPRLCLLIALGALESCGNGGHNGDFFPLVPGSQWQYRVERTTMDGTRQLRHAISVGTPGSNEPADVRTRVTLDGQRYLYKVADDGIYRIGVQRRHGQRLAEDDQQQLVMPAKPTLSQHWQGRSPTTLLESSAPPWETLFRVQVPVVMRYRVAAIDAEITTAAGEFDHCVVIEGAGSADADLGNGVGPASIAVTSREWYAPSVGLVRMERDEKSSAKPLSAGALVMELDEWSQP